MKKTIFLIFIFLTPTLILSQDYIGKVAEKVQSKKNKYGKFKSYNFFDLRPDRSNNNISSGFELVSKNYSEAVDKGIILTFDQAKVATIYDQDPQQMEITIPFKTNGKTVQLELFQKDIFSPDLKVMTSDGKDITDIMDRGKHYRGIVSGDNNSLVSISVFRNEIIGFISFNDSNYIIGKLKDSKSKHIIYKETDLRQTEEFNCSTEDNGVSYTSEEINYNENRDPGDCVNIYVEAGQSVYNSFGGNLVDTTNFLNGVFGQSYVIYANEGITMQTSSMLIWTTPDPYVGPSSANYNAQFKANTAQGAFNGDLGHLVEVDNVGGIAAGFSGICNPDTDQSLCFSGFSGTGYNNVPTYSFNVFILTHEMGHLLGSRHTHACVWNGNGTAIDTCSGFTEGGCPLVGSPPSGGTIMSYCHNDPVGINFTEGFGLQPGNVIRNTVNSPGNCLGGCSLVQIVCPANINVDNDPGTCGAIVTFEATVTNPIPTSVITYSQNPGTVFPVGTTTVIATATNANGTDQCTFTVTVTDVEAPTIICPADIIVSNDLGECGAVVTFADPVAEDNCSSSSGLNEDFESGPNGWTTGSLGAANNWLISDNSGENFPFGNLMYGVPHSGDFGHENSFLLSPVFDSTGGGDFEFDYFVNNEDDPYDQEIVQISYNGGASWTTVIGTQLPNNPSTIQSTSFSISPANATANTRVRFIYDTIDDCCGPQDGFWVDNISFGGSGGLVVTTSSSSGDTFPVGVTTVTATAVDGVGNTTTCSFDVTVTDTEAPTITCPDDITVSNDLGECGAVVTYADPVAEDNCDLILDESYCKEMNVTRLIDSNNETATFEISTDEWHYLAITKSDDLTGKIYLDGNLVGEGTFLDVNYNWSQLYLGVSYFTSWRKHFKGWLDEFRVSSVVRTEQEILENFEANTSLELDANTLGLWHLDEPNGNFFNNSVPGMDDGELFSGAQFTDGRFGNSVYFDGIDDRGDCYTNIPESNVTFEIWLKIQGEEDQENVITPFEAYGSFNTSSDIFDNCDSGGNVSGVIDLDGVNDYIQVEGGILNNVNSGTLQVSCKFDPSTNHKNIFFYGSGSDSEPGIELRANEQGPYFSWHPGPGNVQSIYVDEYVDVFEWHTYTAQWDENSMELYVDGTLVASSTAFGPALSNVFANIRIGRMGNNTSTYTNLSLDFVRLYNSKLYSDNFDTCQTPPSENLILDFEFNNDNNTVATDLSGNNYDGTIYNSPLWLEEQTNDCLDDTSQTGVTQTAGLASGEEFPVGTTTNTFVVTDGAGNTATCSFNVTVNDTEDPTWVIPPSDLTVACDGSGNTTEFNNWLNNTFSGIDNCSSVTITTNSTGLSDDCGATGTETVTFTLTDSNNNAITLDATFTIVDTTDPTMDVAASDLIIQCDDDNSAEIDAWLATNGGAVASDACSGITWTNDFTTVNEDVCGDLTTVTFTATDECGNVTTTVANINTEDTIPPVIGCPGDVTAVTEDGDCGAIVVFQPAVAIDNCGTAFVYQTGGLGSGSVFPVGDTLIEYTAQDECGNLATCTFTVTVIDDDAPVAICQDLTVILDDTGNATITANQLNFGSNDNCGIGNLDIDIDTFDCSNVGANEVTLTVTDIHGNTATCVASVTVLDNTAPIAVCQDITLELGNNGTVTIDPLAIDGGSSDACGIASYELDIDTLDCSNLGNTAVILTVTDVNGNQSLCSAIVTLEDNTPPVLVCNDVTVELNQDGVAFITPSLVADIDDNCGTGAVTVDVQEVSCTDIGTPVTVNVFANDGNGNSAVCSAVVTVVDLLAPEIVCPDDQVVNLGPDGTYTIGDYIGDGSATATDNCTDPVTVFTQIPVAGTVLGFGTQVITFTAEDQYGNVSTCSFELDIQEILGAGDIEDFASLILYPNPADSKVNLSNPRQIDLNNVTIYDLTGRIVNKVDLSTMGSEITIDIANLANATYMLLIRGDQGISTKQLIVNNY